MDESQDDFVLLDCPDCGGVPEIKEYYRTIEGVMFSGVACEECDLVALHFNTESGIRLWNEMVSEWSGRSE